MKIQKKDENGIEDFPYFSTTLLIYVQSVNLWTLNLEQLLKFVSLTVYTLFPFLFQFFCLSSCIIKEERKKLMIFVRK